MVIVGRNRGARRHAAWPLTQSRRRLASPCRLLLLLIGLCASLDVAQAVEPLRLQHDRKSLVFTSGERWRLVITPQDVTLPARTTAKMQARMTRAHGRAPGSKSAQYKGAIWKEEQPSRLVAREETTPWELVVPIPDAEGVYYLDVTLVPDKTRVGDRFGMSERFGNPFRPSEPFATRRLQFVVLGSQPLADASEASWREIIQFDPAQSRWWERLAELPATVRWPGRQPRALDNGLSGTWQHDGQAIVRLEAGGWQAFALPVAQVGRPHVVEIEYPNNVAQTLGVSILQAGVDGRTVSADIDTGFDVVNAPVIAPGMETYRLTYWPRVEHPYLVLVNRRDEAPAAFGQIRVLAGPRHLPPVAPSPSQNSFRRPLAHFDAPTFFRAFGASHSWDPTADLSHDDWLTFYTGAVRLDEYLRHVGYSGAVLTFADDGSVLYPSNVLPPASDSERGILFGDGDKSRRPDVAEMLFRLFDRSGLELVPKLRLSGAMPQLETLLQHPEAGIGVTLVGAEGQTWKNATASGALPISRYNPLHPVVQSALIQAVAEVAERYGHHRSFAGIVIDLAPGTPTHLPGIDWGRDHQTLATFRQDVGSIEPVMQAPPSQWDPTTQKAWIHWRAEQLARLYRRMAQQLRQVAPQAQLMLDGAKLIDLPSLQRFTRPALPPRVTFDQALRELGIEADRYRRQDGIVLLRMHRLQPTTANATQSAAMTQFNRAREVDAWASPNPGGARSMYHPSHPIRLAALDHANLFGQQGDAAILSPQLPPAGANNRARWIHSLAAGDALTIIDGGEVVPLGQEDTVRTLIDTVAKMPAEPFATYDGTRETSPIVVRSLSRPEGLYVYVLNDSPWPVGTKIQMAAPVGTQLQAVSSLQEPSSLTANPTGGYVWSLDMEPYSLVAVRISSPTARITNVENSLPPQVAADLRGQIADFQMRLARLREPQSLPVPENRNFDTLVTDDTIPGWEISTIPGTRMQVDPLVHFNGVASLKMESQGPAASVRSSVLPSPTTGRLSLHVQLKASQGRDLPSLKLAIEGQYEGRAYYRSAAVNLDRRGSPGAKQWSQFVLNVDDLPAGGLDQVRVRFELLGSGVVWLDEVRVFDTWFSPREQRELSKIAALADFQLRDGKFNQCREVLNSYWPNFLTQYIEVPAKVASLPSTQTAPTPAPPESPSEDDRSVIDRMRRFLPKMPRIQRR